MKKRSVSRPPLIVWIVCCVLFPFTTANATEVLHALKKCPEDIPACMEMDINMIWPPDLPDEWQASQHPNVSIEARDEMDPDTVTYRISVSGRLDGGETKPYDLFFTGGGEMACTDFMNGMVATIGFNTSGEGIILTREGSLELMNAPLRLGCENCVALIDEKSLEITFAISPSWYRGSGPVVHSDGRIFWKNGDRCLRMPSNEWFTIGKAEDCNAPSLERASQESVRAVRGQKSLPENRLESDLYKIPNSDFLIYIYGVACT